MEGELFFFSLVVELQVRADFTWDDKCFKTDDQLIVGYSVTPAFG